MGIFFRDVSIEFLYVYRGFFILQGGYHVHEELM